MEFSRSRKRLILAISCVEAFMATLDGSIVNIALPDIAKQMRVSISTVQWVSSAYLLAIVLLLLVWGKLADLHGQKPVIIIGFLCFGAGSLMCSLSPSLDFLIVSRVLQAVGASSMMALSQGMVTGTFEPGERGAALGQVGMMVAVGSLTGPSLGGILVNAFGWPSIFIINVPIAVFSAVLSYFVLPSHPGSSASQPFDWKGTAFFSFVLLVFFLPLLLVQQGSLSALWLLPAFAAAAAGMAAFIHTERHADDPLVHLSLFKARPFTIGLLQGYLIFLSLSATLLFMPFYLQDLLGYSALHAGLIISVYPLAMAFVSPLSGHLADRMSTKPLTVIGTSISTVSLFLFAAVGQKTPIALIIAALILLGVGNGMFQSPNNTDVFGAVPPDKLGIAGGVSALFRNVGFVSGTAFSVLIFSLGAGLGVNAISGHMDSAAFLRGFSPIFIFCGICAAVSLSSCFIRAAKSLRA